MRVLVIEDEIMVLKSIEFKLKKEGFEVITAPDGKAAHDLLLSDKFDIILTDLMIPYYSGLELINFVRNELKSKVPIIVLSSIGQEASIMEAFKLGANDYMTKPFIPNELIIRIRKEALR
ncbi:MAG: response regulator transcription factor [Paludibacter sp.]|nr:response regulator transcription factor [Paludibacter sp.]